MMRAYAVQGSFGLANLVLQERPSLQPGPGEVVVAPKVVALNYRDLLVARGHYNAKWPLPLVPCSDAVGEVLRVGPGVRNVAVGDRVMTTFFQGWDAGRPTKEKIAGTLGGPIDGVLAEEMVTSAQGLVPAPGYLSDEEAATLPCAALTAWSALVTMGQLKAGDRVVVQGTGGVSLFALQFAKMHGASVVITSSQDEKLAKARKLGADEGINYKSTPDWGLAARRWARGLGVDHVVEVGGSGTLDQSIKAVAPGGTISLIGVLAPVTGPVNLVPVLMQNIRIQGVLVGHKESFEAMVAALDAAQCHPIVDRVFPFEDAREAFDYLASGQHFGKICVRVR